MRIGVTLPTFGADAASVLRAARAAEDAGLHGVFVFDHLWPMGQPERPSLSCHLVLAAVAARTERLRLGPLVARVGLLPDELTLATIRGLQAVAGDRLIAGLGTGDHKSADEHRRYGLVQLGPAARQESLLRVATLLSNDGIECWVGAGAAATNDAARATAVTLNFWGVSPETIRRESGRGPTTWAGPLPAGTPEAAETLRRIEDAGASWAVWGWPSSLAAVAEAATAAGIDLARC